MNKHLLRLLSLMLACSAALHAVNDTGKTFLSMGGQRNVAERVLFTEHHVVNNNEKNEGSLQVMPFYKKSSGGKRIAEALSPAGKQTTSYGATGLDVDVKYSPDKNWGDYGSFILATDPQHEEFGMHFSWQQRLDKLLNGLFIEVDAPLVVVKHQINPIVLNNEGDYPEDRAMLEGNVTYEWDWTTFESSQVNHLTYYRGDRVVQGVADVAVKLGYMVFEKDQYRVALNVNGVIPTGDNVVADNLFAPQLGDDRHWALGAGLSARGTWDLPCDWELRGILDFDYHYRFANRQQRMVGLKDPAGVVKVPTFINTSLYGDINQGTRYPLANKTTISVNVTGGSAVNLVAGFVATHHAFSADVAYELNSTAAEKVVEASGSGFVEDSLIRYGTDNNVLGGSPTYVAGIQLIRSNLDFAPATNPAKLTHKIVGSVGYTLYHDQANPIAMSSGASYTFGSNRTAFQGFGVFSKVGISF